MKITEKNMDYITKLHLQEQGEKHRDFSELTKQDEGNHKISESNQRAENKCSVNDIYERMNQNGCNKTFTDIGVYNMSYDTTLYISDAGTLTCIDEKKGRCYVLWEIPLTKNEEAKIDELIKKKMDFILRDKGIVEEYLKGNINIEDIEKWQAAAKDHSLQDSIFTECSDDIKKAWEKIQGTDGLSKRPFGKDYLLTEMDKYMLTNLSSYEKIKDGSLEDILGLVNTIIDSLKNSLELYSVSIQPLKLEELNTLEKFSEELEKLK